MFGKSVMYVKRKIVLDNIPILKDSEIENDWLNYVVNVLNSYNAAIENIDILKSGNADDAQKLKVELRIRCRTESWGMIEEELKHRRIIIHRDEEVKNLTTEVC